MANLPETSNFDAGVYEIATTDLVLGGIAGPANAPTINLTNRTRWLFDQNTANLASIATLNGQVATINGQISTINGQITSINANLASINAQLPSLAPLASPNFTGVPTGPTPGGLISTNQLITAAFVNTWYAHLQNPNFTGVPTAPTAASGTSTTQLATTAFVLPGSSIGFTGYRKNPDGTIEQWGSANPAGGGVTVTFPIAFPSSCYVVEAISIAGGGVQTWLGAAPNTANFNLHNSGGSALWRAFGI